MPELIKKSLLLLFQVRIDSAVRIDVTPFFKKGDVDDPLNYRPFR